MIWVYIDHSREDHRCHGLLLPRTATVLPVQSDIERGREPEGSISMLNLSLHHSRAAAGFYWRPCIHNRWSKRKNKGFLL